MIGQCNRFNSTLINMFGMLPPEWKANWRGSIGVLVYPYNCTQNSAMGFSPYFLMYGRQPWLFIDITPRLTLKSITAPTSTKYIQKLMEHIRWAHRKADLFQQKEVWCHKHNYDKQSMAVSFRMRHMVLVHVTALKGTTKSRVGGRTGSMWWSGSPIQTY